MKKLNLFIIFLLGIFLLSACGKTVTPSSVYIWKPKTKDARFLKAEYIKELSHLADTLVEYGNKVQTDGVGFTTNYKCSIGSCTKDENAENWLFVILQEKTVDSKKYKTYEDRASYLVEKRLKDVLFALKKDFLLNSNGKISGVLVSFIWSNKVFRKKDSFESIDSYIDIETFNKYQSKEIDYKTLLSKTIFINSTKDKKYAELSFKE